MERSEIDGRVRALVAETLGVPEETVGSRSLLVQELGASSIDLIEINFRLEQAFGIEISGNEFWNLADDRTNPEYFRDGRITPAGIEMLKRRFVRFEEAGIRAGDPAARLFESFSVGMITDYIDARVGRGLTCESQVEG